MDNAAIISIRPKWCRLIASGQKTVELRKTQPRTPLPLKCYIYCTKDPKQTLWLGRNDSYVDTCQHDISDVAANGKIIGEFICDSIKWIAQEDFIVKEEAENVLRGSCLTNKEGRDYLGLPRTEDDDKYRQCYGWHISELKMYDQPKELIGFSKTCPKFETKTTATQCLSCDHYCHNNDENFGNCDCHGKIYMDKAPQSWCYVNAPSD